MSKNFNGYLCALFAIFFWSFNVIYSKYLAGIFTPFEISFIRWVVPSIMFLPFCYKDIIKYRKEFIKYLPLIMILALSGLGFQNTFVYYAGHTANAVDMALIGAISPVFLLILSIIFLHHKIAVFEIIGILCALLGVAVVILDGNITDFSQVSLTIGDFWMLIAAFVFAVYSIAEKKLPKNIPQLASFTLMICISSIIFLPLAAYDFAHSFPPHINKTDILILIILAVFNSGIAYLIWNRAIAALGAVKTGTLYYLMPVFSAIEAYFLLDEQIYPPQIYGALLVVIGILLSNLGKKHAFRPKQAKQPVNIAQ